MNDETKSLWERALQAYQTACDLAIKDPDAAASRAYYAVFYAVSALFIDENKDFSKHSAIEIAVHRDLVKTKRMSESFGENYSFLRGLRDTGDYGGWTHVSSEDAKESIQSAKNILVEVAKEKNWSFKKEKV